MSKEILIHQFLLLLCHYDSILLFILTRKEFLKVFLCRDLTKAVNLNAAAHVVVARRHVFVVVGVVSSHVAVFRLRKIVGGIAPG